jgi:hypothetical protein
MPQTKYNLIYTRIIVGDVIRTLTKMAREGDPALKPLVAGLTKMQSDVAGGIGTAMGANRIMSSTSTLGKMAGVATIAAEVANQVLAAVATYQKTGSVAQALTVGVPQGMLWANPLVAFILYLISGVENLVKQAGPVPVPASRYPAWREIPFAGSGEP